MTDMVFVAPAAGGRVRQPERNGRVMPDSGAWVPLDSFYERLIAAGDVIRCDPPAVPDAETPTVEDRSSTNAMHQGRGRRASAVKED